MKFYKLCLMLMLVFSTAYTKESQNQDNNRIEYIQFKKINLEALFDYLSSRYNVNIILEPQLRYYTISLRLRDVTLEEVINIVAQEYQLKIDKKANIYYIKSRKKYHEKNYYNQDFMTETIEVNYASIPDIIYLLQDLMKGTIVVRSTVKTDAYANLIDQTPSGDTVITGGLENEQSQNGVLNQQSEATQENTTRTSSQLKKLSEGGKEASLESIAYINQDESLPERILYVVPFINENIIYFLSKDKDLIKNAKAIVKEVDKPTKQVLIQGKIINVTLDDGFSSFFAFDKATSAAGGTAKNSTLKTGDLQYTFLSDSINMSMEILQTNGKAKTIASPMLLTSNRVIANLDLVEEISIIDGWTVGTTSITNGVSTSTQSTPIYTKQSIGTQFEIMPFINKNGEILLNINIAISTLVPGSQQILVPNALGGFDEKKLDGVKTTSIQTLLSTKHAQGIVLGGLINETVSKKESKVPLLGDIPYLGFFFKNVQDVAKKSELVVILTPYVVDLRDPNAHKLMNNMRESTENDRYILGDDANETRGEMIIDNIIHENHTQKLNDAQKRKDIENNYKKLDNQEGL